MTLLLIFDFVIKARHPDPERIEGEGPLALALAKLPALLIATALCASPAPQAAIADAKVTADERQRIIQAVIQQLKQHYFDPTVAQKMSDTLIAHERKNDDAAATGESLANLLTHQLREVSHDPHLEVVYSATPLPPQPTEPTPEEHARYQKSLEQQNCLFEKTQILPHNIGYLKLTGFPEPSICRRTATTAMSAVNHTDALIIDLRDNRGGSGDMVLLLAAYLFNHPQYIYDPRELPGPHSQTRSPIPGNKLADKPVSILTSTSTISAGEQFTYNMKMLKRATLIGETTQGSAHAGVWYRIDDHFGIAIPAVKPHNPYSNTDWAAVGVEPDIKVTAANALETAEKLAEKRLPKK